MEKAVKADDVVSVARRRGQRAVDLVMDQSRRLQAELAAAMVRMEPHRGWYVLMVASGHEIETQVALRDRLGVLSMVPVGVRWSQVASHVRAKIGANRVRREFILMDGYVFVDAYDPSALRLPYVFGFVGAPEPVAVSARVLAQFAEAIGRHGSHDETAMEPDDPARVALDALMMHVGRMVSVMDGPFAGRAGILRAVRPAGLARIEMSIMGRAVRADVPAHVVGVA